MILGKENKSLVQGIGHDITKRKTFGLIKMKEDPRSREHLCETRGRRKTIGPFGLIKVKREDCRK
jgi:hypothetical protein